MEASEAFDKLPAAYDYSPSGLSRSLGMNRKVIKRELERKVKEGNWERRLLARPDAKNAGQFLRSRSPRMVTYGVHYRKKELISHKD